LTKKSAQQAKQKSSLTLKVLRWLIAVLILFTLFSALFIGAIYLGLWGPLPSKSELANISNARASEVYSADEVLIGKIYRVNRSPVQFEDLPSHLLEALIATEDQRFYQHRGIDHRSFLRVVIKSILMGDASAGGGSTLTQQLVKNLYGRKNYGLLSLPVAKFKEMIVAYRLESVYSKSEILELYLNTVSFSENTYGIRAGSQRFFSCEPQQLRCEQSAVLVGLLKANTYYNPRLNPQPAQARRNVVLSQMQKAAFLTAQQADSLQSLPLGLRYRNLERGGEADYFLAQVERKAQAILSQIMKENGEAYDLKQDGLVVKTTLNYQWQVEARVALIDHLGYLQKKYDRLYPKGELARRLPDFFESQLQKVPEYQQLLASGLNAQEILEKWSEPKEREVFHPTGYRVESLSRLDSLAHYLQLLRGGVMALDPNNGKLRVWVGGPDHRTLPFDQILAKRQVASTIKPFVFANALENGATPCDYRSAQQRRYPQYGDWAPANYDADYDGFYSMAGALAQSVNTVTVAWLFELGLDRVLAFAQSLGLRDLPAEPSVSLGSSSHSLYQLLGAYAVFANGGKKLEVQFIESIHNAAGEIIYRASPSEPKRLLSRKTAAQMNAMLQEVVKVGTARSLRTRYGLSNPLAGKTGSSQNYSDAWFVGYNPRLVVGVRMGGTSPLIRFDSGALGSGSTMALPVFAKFWKSAEAEGQPDLVADFPPLDPAWQQELDCPPWRKRRLGDIINDLLKDKPGEALKEDQEEPSFWKRLFKPKSN
jgi:penicillin-binding protein 1A